MSRYYFGYLPEQRRWQNDLKTQLKHVINQRKLVSQPHYASAFTPTDRQVVVAHAHG